MLNTRAVRALCCAAALSLGACAKGGASTTTSPTPVAADATTTENLETTIAAGGGVSYAFAIAAYGNVAVTLSGVSGTDLPDDFTLGLGIGRPSGTSCSTSSTISTAPGDSPQLTGTYGPGIFCVWIYDAGTLTAPVRVTASVAHS